MAPRRGRRSSPDGPSIRSGWDCFNSRSSPLITATPSCASCSTVSRTPQTTPRADRITRVHPAVNSTSARGEMFLIVCSSVSLLLKGWRIVSLNIRERAKIEVRAARISLFFAHHDPVFPYPFWIVERVVRGAQQVFVLFACAGYTDTPIEAVSGRTSSANCDRSSLVRLHSSARQRATPHPRRAMTMTNYSRRSDRRCRWRGCGWEGSRRRVEAQGRRRGDVGSLMI